MYQWDLCGSAERLKGKKPSTELVDWPTFDQLCLFFSPLCCLFCVGGNCKHCLSLSSYVSSFPHPPHHCNALQVSSIFSSHFHFLVIPLSLSSHPTFTFFSSHVHFHFALMAPNSHTHPSIAIIINLLILLCSHFHTYNTPHKQ